jgi:hypothetical protein
MYQAFLGGYSSKQSKVLFLMELILWCVGVVTTEKVGGIGRLEGV